MFSRSKKSNKETTPAADASTGSLTPTRVNASNPSKVTPQEVKARLADTEISLAGVKVQLRDEKASKRKLYASLVKLASELNRMKAESKPLRDAMDYANRSWYEGGMWRPSAILPGVTSKQVKTVLREATGLSALFFNLVIVTAFTRVGRTITESGSLSVDSLLYFAVFWMIWTKDTSYTTRFDSSDLSFEIVNLLSCIAVLCGSLSINAPINTETGGRIMMTAGFVAVLHMLLHLRVAISFRSAAPGSVEESAKKHAIFSIILTICETATWASGVFVPQLLDKRQIIFVAGIFFSVVRLPKNFLDNDFHAASSKRGVIFILLLGFLLQSVVVVASPFFEYQSPNVEQYGFIGACGLMLYCIKLLYSDDAPKLAQDHALLVNGVSAFFFNIGQFALLLSTTALGAGLEILTHSYLAATSALPRNAKEMVCGGFGAVLFSILFIKSMHLKRIPLDGVKKALFVGAYMTQIIVTLAVVGMTITICLGKDAFALLVQNEISLMLGLSGVALFLVILSWLDEAVELAMYDNDDDSRQALVHPFGLWWCVAPELQSGEGEEREEGSGALSSMTPLLSKSVANMKISESERG